MQIKTNGSTRMVVLAGRFAFKFPSIFNGWQNFLLGLLGNCQEKIFSDTKLDCFCPIVLSIPGGWLNVMVRAKPLTEQEWENFDYIRFIHRQMMVAPVEQKKDSFGTVNGKIVAVDYG